MVFQELLKHLKVLTSENSFIIAEHNPMTEVNSFQLPTSRTVIIYVYLYKLCEIYLNMREFVAHGVNILFVEHVYFQKL